ncbi:bifunctional lysylphosphatidylglycerol flippase/synthetase MprF [Agrobacterium tumefaciens]|uniref:bifunctional lysylphosphatidylglycerol flippase/synthetase MprF n=1 Tax=Agrobacterium tumefaciens TaxID=358 RepID=UPI0012951C6B|nr:bifunctional lysylphosphatidylglycerol flippase/synthetase MprF [Agrobacterium tumefaciens]MQB39553.1 bifunctional lysylphosphatidylglycerol flippase/synthetase MprF [Agrobacterium tumefaciens]
MADKSEITQTDVTESAVESFFARNRPYLTAIAITLVFVMMTFAIYHLTSEVRYDDVIDALTQTSTSAVLLAIVFTALSFLALIFYDANAIEYIGRKLPFPPMAATAFAAYAIGNTAGFGPLSGGAIRFRAYSRLGLSPGEIARVIAFVTLSFGLGLLSVSAISTFIVAPRIAAIIGVDAVILRGAALAIIAVLVVAAYVGRNGHAIRLGKWRLRLPDSRTSSRQFLVSAFDIAASASVLYVLLPDTHLGWPTFFAIYATAVGLGVLSHVPAGLGVFETVMVAGLGNAISVDQLLGSLVLYRVIYHVLPLVVAILVMLVSEMKQFAAKPVVSDISQLAVRLAPPLLSTFAMILGTMLIFSSVTPTPDSNLDFLSNFVPLPIVEAAHFLTSILGLVLVVASRGLGQRLDGAWWIALVAASLALVLSLLKAIAVFEAAILGVFIAALSVNMRSFNRHASLVKQALGPSWLAAMAVIIAGAATILLFVYRDTDYSQTLWWQFEFSEEAPRGLRALLGLVLASSTIAIFSLMRPVAFRPDAIKADDVTSATGIVMTQDAADANLVRMGDKHVMFSESGNAFIMYGIQGRSWIAFTDPVGDEDDFPDLVWQFVEAARAAGARAAFYQISPFLLSHCADAGLRAFKLGELALVDLTAFELKGGKLANLRQSLSRGARDGLTFEVIEQAQVADIMDELKQVSDGWLAHHNTREKRFSLGAFEPDYILSQPVAVLRKDGKITAFANLMVTATKKEATVDLMRFSPDAPRGSMDLLFVSIMQYLREAGYESFNLGMAPMSGMSKRDAAPVWDRIGSTLFEHGERFYNFKGLRAFKAKFHPKWEPRYLAVQNGADAALALMDATVLISGGVRGVIGK